MVPLRIQGQDWVRKADDAPHRSTAFRHATLHGRPGLWGDDPVRPTSVVWLREGDNQDWEAFGAGRPSPAINWLATRSGGKSIALLAPASWEGPIRLMGGRVNVGFIETRFRPENVPLPNRSTRIEIRRLFLEDGPAFESLVPTWALRSWENFEAMIDRGAAFGVPMPGGFASLAWTYESDSESAKIGVTTLPRYRKLGLATAAASSLIGELIDERRQTPLWVTTSSNEASIALASSLGFSIRVEEKLIDWTFSDQAEEMKNSS